MTKDGKQNRFGRFVLDDEQAERITAGDMSAVWEFIEQNRRFLTALAHSWVYKHLAFIPNDIHGSFYKPEELLNQIYVDFPLYKLESEHELFNSIFRSFRGISCGGYLKKHKARQDIEISLEAPLTVSARNGDKSDGSTLKDLLPSLDPLPFDVIANTEHVKKIAPRIFLQLADVFHIDLEHMSEERGATVGDNVRHKAGERLSLEQFQEVIEEIFFGMSFEEVQAYVPNQKHAA